MDNQNAHGSTRSRVGVFPYFDIYRGNGSQNGKWLANIEAKGLDGFFEAYPASRAPWVASFLRNWRVWGTYRASSLSSDTLRDAFVRSELERFLELCLPHLLKVQDSVGQGWGMGGHIYCRKHLIRERLRDEGEAWKYFILAQRRVDGKTLQYTEYSPPSWFWNGVGDCVAAIEAAVEPLRRASGDCGLWEIDAFRQCYTATYQEENGVVTEYPFVRPGCQVL